MENQEERSLVAMNTTQISTDMFGESKTKKLTSLDLTDEVQVDMYLNSMQSADYKLNDVVGKVIDCIGAVITETPFETLNEDTGEVVVRKKHAMTLFDTEGKSYVTGSGACYYSFVNIVGFKGMPTKDNALKLEVIKVPAKEQGHSYLKLKIVK